MKRDTYLRIFLTGLFFLANISGLLAADFDGKAVSMKVVHQEKFLEIKLKIKNGFGIQKKGPHDISFYSLNSGYQGKNDPAKIINEHGKKIQEIKPLQLSGTTAKQDAEYFSEVNSFKVPFSAAGNTGIKLKIYYCSFGDSFCSVDALYSIIKTK